MSKLFFLQNFGLNYIIFYFIKIQITCFQLIGYIVNCITSLNFNWVTDAFFASLNANFVTF